MVLGRFVKKLFGGAEPVVINDDPFGRDRPAPPPPPEQRQGPRTLVHRDEIIDGRSRICGYRFAARSVSAAAPALPAAAVEALRTEGIVRFAERRLALLPLRLEDWQAADFRQFAAPQTIFLLEAPAPGGDAAAWLGLAEAIKAAGGRLGLPGAALGPALEAALPLADLVLLDFADYGIEALERLAGQLRERHPGLALAADGVPSWPEHRLCQSLGFRYCLGSFAANRDEEDRSDRLNNSRLVLIEMLNLLRRDAEVGELAAVAKRDPGVAVHVLAMANSPLSGLANPVTSIDQAIVVLGRQILYRWLMVSMFRAGGDGRDESLLELALCRARFLELLAREASCPKAESDELFLVGLLSLMDSLLGQPMETVLARMHLPKAVADVLLRSEGSHGRYLMLALAMEKGRVEQAAALAEALGIATEAVKTHSAAALAWAEEALAAGR